jgi:hypothetical protein
VPESGAGDPPWSARCGTLLSYRRRNPLDPETARPCLALGVALPAAAGGPPPSIDEIDGAKFSVRVRGPSYDLAGSQSKGESTIEWTITKTGAETVSLDTVFGGMLFTAVYVDGFLLQARATPEVPPLSGSSMSVAVSGKPGKLKLKGTFTTYAAGSGFRILSVLKVSGKQIP